MTDLSTTPTAKIAARVIDLHKKATPGPWQTSGVRIKIDGEPYLTVGGDTEVWALVSYGNGSAEHHTRAHADQRLIAYYRTACVELAKRCLKAEAQVEKLTKDCLGFMADAVEAESEAEAVAAKSREEALDAAIDAVNAYASERTERAGRLQSVMKTMEAMNDSTLLSLAAGRIRRLKSSRTDSGQPPATLR